MKRIDTGTRSVDKHGTGRDGFTNGVPSVTPPTQLDATWFDHLQEEVARCVELENVALDDTTFDQLSDVVRDGLRDVSSPNEGYTIQGGDWGSFSGLQATLTGPIVYYANGRRYTVTTINGSDAPRTFTDDQTTYVYIVPDSVDPEAYSIVETTTPTPLPGRALLAVITTAGGIITGEVRMEKPSLRTFRCEGIEPESESVDIGSRSFLEDSVTGRINGMHCKEHSKGINNSDGTRDEHRGWPIIIHTVSGAATQNTNLLDSGSAAEDDVVLLRLKAAGKRTDASNFEYVAVVTCGAVKQGGNWVLTGTQSVDFEQGDGGGARTVRFTLSSGVLRVTTDITGTEDWRMVISVELVTNYG